MLDLQEWIEKQWPSKMFFDPRVHERTIFILKTAVGLRPTAVFRINGQQGLDLQEIVATYNYQSNNLSWFLQNHLHSFTHILQPHPPFPDFLPSGIPIRFPR